jgi:Na+/H+-dicarboxylate symporter
MRKFRLPLVLFLVLVLSYYFGYLIPYELKAFFLAISISLKEILLFVLPMVIFSFIAHSLLSLQGQALRFITLLLLCVFLSNSLAIFSAYFIGNVFFADLLPIVVEASPKDIVPMSGMVLSMPKVISNKHALIAAFVTGILFSYKKNQAVEKAVKYANDLSLIFLKKLFIPCLPLFIFGSVLRLEHQGVLGDIFNSYSYVFIVVVSSQLIYLFMLYLLANKFSIKKLAKCIPHILPVTLTGFGTISSAAAMGALIVAMGNIIKNTTLYQMIVPSVVNIHTLGSAIGVTLISMATMKTFGMELPGLALFSIFALHYALQKFGVAAVPGGVICVVGPILDEYLGFSGEMIGMVTAIYMLFDPFGTACNITANGAFTMLFDRLFTMTGKWKIFAKK